MLCAVCFGASIVRLALKPAPLNILNFHAVQKSVTLRFYDLEDEGDYTIKSMTFTQKTFDRWMTASCCILLEDVTPEAPAASVMAFGDLVAGHEYIVDVGICLLLL